MVPHDQWLQNRINMINHYKNQEPPQQRAGTQIPMNIAQEGQIFVNDQASLQNHVQSPSQ